MKKLEEDAWTMSRTRQQYVMGAGTREGDGLQEPISSSAHQVSVTQHLYDGLGQAGEVESPLDQAETRYRDRQSR